MWVRRKVPLVEAHQWWIVGDHPAVKKIPGDGVDSLEKGTTRVLCLKCHRKYADHGVVAATLFLVCPGDWIVNTDAGLVVESGKTFFDKFIPAVKIVRKET